MIIAGNRGTGKTAIIADLITNGAENNSIICCIEDYSSVPFDGTLSPQIFDFYKLIINNLVKTLFENLIGKEKLVRKLDLDSKIFLSYLLHEYVDTDTKSILARKIEGIQLTPLKRFIKRNINAIRSIFNYGANVATNAVNDVLQRNFSMLPKLTENQIRDIFPKIDVGVDTDFNIIEASYHLLDRICSLILQLGFNRITIFIDKLDEDSRIDNDADDVACFIKPLLTENKLLLSSKIQLIISIWEIPFNKIKSSVRTQKHFCPELHWENSDLKKALNRRIEYFSDNSINDFMNLFDADVTNDEISEIFTLSNANPRDLWHIFNKMLVAQYKENSSKNKISKKAIQVGIKNFVQTFNFYEYYPKKNNARANSMDVYAYIKHLLKLPNYRFTKNTLNECAQTGSSTGNYVVGMEGLGLIVKTEDRINGGVVYKINDPKIIFALNQGIEISRP